MADKLFYFLTFLALLSAVMVVFSRNPVHSVLYLILTFFALSGHYVLLNAQFLAVVNLIVYAGAIMVLFLFTIMFLNMKDQAEASKPMFLKLSAVVLGGLFLMAMVVALQKMETTSQDFDAANYNSQAGMVESLGQALFSKFLLPFELVSVLFLVAMAGAVMLGRREEGERNSF